MNWNTIEFCPELPPKDAVGNAVCGDVVAKLLADNLFNGSTQAQCLLSARYRQMRDNYSNVPHDDSRWDLKIGTKKIKREGADEAALLPVCQTAMPGCVPLVSQLWNHANFGHDMPTWMVKHGVKNPHRVMIISQDPLRTNQDSGKIVLSTPFGFHSADYRNICCQNHTLCYLVERLLEEANACVYLTDCMKFYTSDGFIKSRHKQFYPMFNATLQAEVTAFVPEVILTLGNVAAKFCRARPPREGYKAQPVGGRKLIASYHTGAWAIAIKNFVTSGSVNAYFNLIFNEVYKVLKTIPIA